MFFENWVLDVMKGHTTNMKKQQFKKLIQKVANDNYLHLVLVEEQQCSTCEDEYWLTYYVMTQQLTICISATCGVIETAGECTGIVTLEKICSFDRDLMKVIR